MSLRKVLLGIMFCLKQKTVYVFFFQAEGGILDIVRCRGLGDVYKRLLQKGCGGCYMIVMPVWLGTPRLCFGRVGP